MRIENDKLLISGNIIKSFCISKLKGLPGYQPADLLVGKLSVIQLLVIAFLFQQFFMSSLFHDIAVLHYKYQICIFNS